MLSIAKPQSKHSGSTLIFQKIQHILLYFFFIIVHQCLQFFSALSQNVCIQLQFCDYARGGQLLKALCSEFCCPLSLFHLQPTSLLMKLDNEQVGVSPVCSLVSLSSPVLTFSSPVPRNCYQYFCGLSLSFLHEYSFSPQDNFLHQTSSSTFFLFLFLCCFSQFCCFPQFLTFFFFLLLPATLVGGFSPTTIQNSETNFSPPVSEIAFGFTDSSSEEPLHWFQQPDYKPRNR